MEFWQDWVTEKSWKILTKIKKEFDFVLIGGWAAYLHTSTLKSKDIDLVINLETLYSISKRYNLSKNEFLRKYEVVLEGVSVDIYVEHYSKFCIEIKEILNNFVLIEGFKVVRPDILLILKQEAEKNRGKGTKGLKDRIDLLNLLINSNIDFNLYKELLKKYSLLDFHTHLQRIIKEASDEFKYLGITNPREKKKIKEILLKKIK